MRKLKSQQLSDSPKATRVDSEKSGTLWNAGGVHCCPALPANLHAVSDQKLPRLTDCRVPHSALALTNNGGLQFRTHSQVADESTPYVAQTINLWGRLTHYLHRTVVFSILTNSV